ncbi:MAG: hypothetical protein LBN95_07875 [Prevotellaceae bacterium]|jgi:transcriptional regulator with XRE-family HTH domain|nr:hypothetical protein [Prevotellaceae bacterium]
MKKQEIHIGEFVKDAVKQSEYSFADVAKKAGISRQTFNGWLKKDDWSVKNLFTVSQALGYDLVKSFCLPTENEQETKVVLQIEVEKSKTNEVLKFVKDKQLYNILKT